MKQFSQLKDKDAQALLEKYTVELLRPIRAPHATLRLIQLPSEPEDVEICNDPLILCGPTKKKGLVVTKDYFDCPTLYRNSVARYTVFHENKINQRLLGIPGVPRLTRIHSFALCMQYIQGVDLRRVEVGKLPPTALSQLDEVLKKVHSKGCIHLDISHDSNGDYGRDTNILFADNEGKDGQIYLIDYAGSICFRKMFTIKNTNPPKYFPPKLFDAFVRFDRMAMTKLKARFFQDIPISPEDVPPQWLLNFMRKQLRKF